MGCKRLAILCIGILTLLMLPLDASSALPSGTHKIIVDSSDLATLKELARSGATLLVDYGPFSLWRTNDPQQQAVGARASVTVRDDFDVIHLRGSGVINTVDGAASVAANVRQSKATGFQFWMVQFVGPIKPDWLAKLHTLGIEIVAYMPNNAYVVWLDGPRLTQLEGLTNSDPTVQWNGPYHPAYRLAPSLQSGKHPQTAQLVAVTVEFYRTANVQVSVASLRALGGTVYRPAHNADKFVDISLDVPANQLIAIASRADVFNVEPFVKPGKRDEVQDQIVAGNVTTAGGNIVPTGPGYRAWLQSKGFTTAPTDYPVIAVVDDGIDNGTTAPLHPDFYQGGDTTKPSRLIFNNNCTADAAADGQAGHGNLNVGIVGAYNDMSGYPYVDGNGYNIGLGVSPYGRIAGTKIFDNGTGNFDESACGGTDEGTVLAAYNAGARITSNSWGANTAGAYDTEARAYDVLTRDATNSNSANHEILHVFSAGNSGPVAQSVGSPGTAKNVLTVGATENVRDNGVLDGCGFTNAANADNIAGFSSRGPTTDGRSKPDVVAPGIHIQGPASQDPTYDGTGVCGTPTGNYYPNSTAQTLYTWSSGTSHSAPAVAGVASLVYTYYARVISPGQTPTPAMLKALILNAPRYLTGASANDTLPSPSQGWGDANLGALFDGTPRYVVNQSTTFTATGDTFTKSGTVANAGKPLRITLAWTDAPGSTTGDAFVNNLNLDVTIGGQVYRGNHFGTQFSTPGGMADAKNNVESVFLPAGTSGPFSVRIVAANLADKAVPTGPGTVNQDFALVITNGTVAPTLTGIAVAAPGGLGNPPVIKVGQHAQITATASLSDGSTSDVTNQSQWSSDNTGVAKIDPTTGVVTGQSPGTATITATYTRDGVTKTRSIALTVGTPTAIGIQVAPAPQGRTTGNASTAPPGSPLPAPAPMGR